MAGPLFSQKVIVIVGPTASGKTELSLVLAKIFNGEIILADSRQIYSGMDIGTAKATKFEINNIPHHLMDIITPNQEYSVGQFKKDAIKAIHKIINSDKLPIVVGGTGLYVSALVNNLEIPEVKENKKLRSELEKEIKENGLDHVFKKLTELDPEAANIVDPKNPRRVIRALEVALVTGQPYTLQRKIGKPLFDFLEIGLLCPADALKVRIIKRVKTMYRAGLVNEVKSLIKKYGEGPKAFDAIGYRGTIDYLNGKISLAESKTQMVNNTWHYAKRQITWFKKDKKIVWVRNKKEAIALASEFLGAPTPK